MLFSGSGLGVIYFASIVMIAQYFNTKRGLASGLAYCGSGVGGFIFAPLIEFLIRKYSWKGAVWIVSGIVLNCVPIGAILRPLKKEECKDSTVSHYDSSQIDKTSCQILQSLGRLILAMLGQLKLFKKPLFIIYGMSCFLCTVGNVFCCTFLSDLLYIRYTI